MLKEIYINLELTNTNAQTIKDSLKELNEQQDILFFKEVQSPGLIDKLLIKERQNHADGNANNKQGDFEKDKEQRKQQTDDIRGDWLELNEFYRNVTFKLKNEKKLSNLITVTDLKIFRHNNETSVGTYFANSPQVGHVVLKKQSTIPTFQYELLRIAVQLAFNKYFEHEKDKCFFNKQTNLNRANLCSYCDEKLYQLGLTHLDIQKLNKALQTIKNKHLGIEESTLFSVIIMDIVAYSTVTDSTQKRMIEKLQKIVKNSEMIAQNLENIIFLPTGDGCVIAIQDSLYLCTVKICSEIQKQVRNNNLNVRFGLNSGFVFKYRDVNNNVNIAGSGINMASRAMDVGDSNHIIANRTIYDNLGNLNDWHQGLFHDLGKVPVKHDVHLNLYNVYSKEEDFGNPEIPEYIKRVRLKGGEVASGE